jgi:hypothetical protein
MIFGNCLLMKKYFFILSFLFGLSYLLKSQEINHIVTKTIIIQGDTMPIFSLREVEVVSLEIPKTKKGKRRLTKLVENVKKVYPYAKLAGIQLNKYEDMLLAAETDKERRQIMKQAEQEIKEEYGDELKNLTFTQGKILIKLLDRETGESSFELVQELRGKFTAFWYQAFAKLWGYNLKVKYDPEGEDIQIETIVRLIERGQI